MNVLEDLLRTIGLLFQCWYRDPAAMAGAFFHSTAGDSKRAEQLIRRAMRDDG